MIINLILACYGVLATLNLFFLWRIWSGYEKFYYLILSFIPIVHIWTLKRIINQWRYDEYIDDFW